jgi:hypothetical protein
MGHPLSQVDRSHSSWLSNTDDSVGLFVCFVEILRYLSGFTRPSLSLDKCYLVLLNHSYNVVFVFVDG